MGQIFQNLRLRTCEPKETVFLFGDRGSTFYIIIDGQVEVKTPAIVEFDVEQDEFFQFCLDYFSDIYWKKTTNGSKVL
jgi:hypothetical protein